MRSRLTTTAASRPTPTSGLAGTPTGHRSYRFEVSAWRTLWRRAPSAATYESPSCPPPPPALEARHPAPAGRHRLARAGRFAMPSLCSPKSPTSREWNLVYPILHRSGRPPRGSTAIPRPTRCRHGRGRYERRSARPAHQPGRGGRLAAHHTPRTQQMPQVVGLRHRRSSLLNSDTPAARPATGPPRTVPIVSGFGASGKHPWSARV